MKDKLEQFFNNSFIVLTCVPYEYISQDFLHEIYLDALKIDGKKLQFVEPEKFTAEQYLTLCSAAIEQNAFALEWVDVSAIDAAHYREFCRQAVKQNGFSLYFVKKDYFQNDQGKLTALYHTAVKQNSDTLQLIQDQTVELCTLAVKKNARALQWVNQALFSKEEYGEICCTAVCEKRHHVFLDGIFEPGFDINHIKNYQALRFVNKDRLSPEKYKEICLNAITYSDESIPFVDEPLWRDKDFCTEAVKLSKKAEKYAVFT
ncbi:hypothetical protein AGMMS49944_19330 [Spirochaetia bacterium]|nr:hypothetical protein AGMMS49944_19330 [Spirochaetia bacterium]